MQVINVGKTSVVSSLGYNMFTNRLRYYYEDFPLCFCDFFTDLIIFSNPGTKPNKANIVNSSRLLRSFNLKVIFDLEVFQTSLVLGSYMYMAQPGKQKLGFI